MNESRASIPLSPIPVPAASTPPPRSRFAEILNGIILILAAAFAFLVSSFAIRNADFWLHLATGRLIAEGKYQFGVDPFGLGTDGMRWVNHAWLYDWVVYQIHGLGGGLVLLKAIVVLATAALMMAIARPARLPWSAVVTAIGILAASPRLLFQPATFSLFLLSLTLFILFHGSPKKLWWLPVLFVLWVNVDTWFILGPLAVFLTALGRWPWDRSTLRLAAFGIGGLMACLLNPHHFHAFQWPMELSPTLLNSPLMTDPRMARLFDSPWDWSRLTRTSGALNPAGIAYFVLVALGIISFGRCRRAWPDGRLALWLFFAAMGAFQARLVPFFAVVATPISSRNFWEGINESSHSPELSSTGEIRPRSYAFALLLLFALNAGVWPGWLQPAPHDLRRVRWAIQPDPSLRLAAERLKTWIENQQVPANVTVFNTHPDAGAYLAWFGPRVRYAIDPRLSLFAEPTTANVFLDSYQTIMGKADLTEKKNMVWPAQPLVLGYESTANQAGNIFSGPLANPEGPWRLLAIDGRASWFGRVTDSSWNLSELTFDAEVEAFQKATPLQLSARFAPHRSFWDEYWRGPGERPASLETAVMYLRQFDEAAIRRQRGADGDPLAAALAQLPVTAMSAPHDMITTIGNLSFRMAHFSLFVPLVDPGPPEYAYLAIRQARLALSENPNLAEAWLRLGQAYLNLRLRTREGAWSRQLTLVDQIRHAQIAYALESALRLEPKSFVAHRMLANLYTEKGYLDIAYEHRRHEIELMRQVGPTFEESQEDFDKNLEAASKRLREMEKQLQDRENQYAVQVGTQGSRPFDQAQTALRLGLARKALDEVLLKSDVRLFGIYGAQLQLHLMLMLGRAHQVHEFLMEPELAENPERLDVVAVAAQGGPGYISEYRMLAYDWYRAMVAAVVGDYEQMERSLLAIERRTKIDAEEESNRVRDRLALILGAEIGVGYVPEIFIYRARLAENRLAFQSLLQGMVLAELLRADLRTVIGLHAVESSHLGSAREHFSAALDLARVAGDEIRNFAGRPAAETMLARLAR